MVHPDSQIHGGPSRYAARRTCVEACKTDDVLLMEQAISLTSQANSFDTAEDVIQYGLKHSAARNAIHVLQYVLDHGADAARLAADGIFLGDVDLKPAEAILEILFIHGWDINTRSIRPPRWPLLWYVVKHHDLVVWCLDHGARVDIPDDPPQIDANGVESRPGVQRPALLGLAASSGSIKTFDLLRAKGAPLAPRTLHRAVEGATMSAPQPGSDDSSKYQHLLNMIRHLIDVVKIDVNAVEHKIGSYCSIPICCAASRPTNQDFRKLVYLLLDRGADPNLDGIIQDGFKWPSATSYAEHMRNESFLRAVQDWWASKHGENID